MEEKQKGGRREMVAYEGKVSTEVEEGKQVKEYPSPLFTHKELCGDPGIFVEALRRFHSLMGTKFMYYLYMWISLFDANEYEFFC